MRCLAPPPPPLVETVVRNALVVLSFSVGIGVGVGVDNSELEDNEGIWVRTTPLDRPRADRRHDNDNDDDVEGIIVGDDAEEEALEAVAPVTDFGEDSVL